MFLECKSGYLLKVKISPNSAKNEVIVENDALKIKLTAQPIENKANVALVELLSKKLKVAKSLIEIVKGETSKEKTVLFKTQEKPDIDRLIS